MLIIGNVAMQHFGLSNRESLDVDMIGTYEELQQLITDIKDAKFPVKEAYPLGDNKFIIKYLKHGKPEIIEFEIAWEGSNSAELLRLVHEYDLYVGNLARPSVLLALKLSHRYKKNSPHFHKTMADIWTLRDAGYSVPDCLQEWFKWREKDTYNYAHPKLNQKKGEFFDASIEYKYDHDSIHLVVARGDRPAYMEFKPEDKDVWCCKKMWDACPLEVKLNAGYEESCVLALERSLVPFEGKLKPKQAFAMALQKVCTSITSGWFREFCWEHYDDIMGLWDDTLMERFNKGLEDGTVKLHTG